MATHFICRLLVLVVGAIFAAPSILISSVAGASEPAVTKLEIQIFEMGTGGTIRRAEVKIDDRTLGYSDREGRITVELGAQDQQLSILRAGFETYELNRADMIRSGPTEIYLTPAQPEDDEVIVRGNRRKSISRKNVSIEEAKAVAPRGDPAQITKLLPGVQADAFGPEVVVRGSAPDDSKYLVDGIEIPFIYHTIGGISVVPVKVLEDVDFSAGAFDVRYGEATGGVIHLGSSNQPAEKPYTQAKINLPFFSGVYHERPLSEDSGISMSARRSYLEAFVSAFSEDGDSTIVPLFWDAHLRYVKRSGRNTTKVLAISSLDGLTFASDGPGDDDGRLTFDISTYFGALGVVQTTALDKKWRYTAAPQVVFAKVKNKILDNVIDIRGPTYRLPVEFERRNHKTDKTYLGFEVEHSNVDVRVLAPKINEDDPFFDFEDAPQVETKLNYSTSQFAGWAAHDFRVTDEMAVTPGLRATYSQRLKASVLDPRLKLVYKLSSEESYKAAVGQYSKSPDPRETDEQFGNPDLDFEHSIHYVLGWERKWSERWNSDVQLYAKRNRNVVRSNSEVTFRSSGEQRSYGLELFLRRNRTSRAFGWLSYTYSITEQRATTADEWRPYEYDQTHVVNLVSGYSLSGKWSVGGRINYHTGDRYTPVSTAVYNGSLGKYQPRYEPEDENAARLPDYWQIDLYNVYDFLFQTWKLKLRTGIEYLAPKRPAFGVTYNYDYSKEEYFTGVPPIPYIELSGEF